MEEEQQLRSGKYTWVIDSFSEKKNKPKFSSDAFTVGGCKWQITMYPGREADYLEIYLGVADTATLPDGCATGTPHLGEESASHSQTTDVASDTPSSDDIEKAKHSLKECLLDLFKLDMRDRLSSALSILSHAGAGLSPDQQRSIETFKANFDDFLCDFLTFELDNSDFELQKITTDRIYSTMKKNRESHLSYKQSFDSLTEEKEELYKRLKEVSSGERELISDWETLIKESEEVKLKCAIQEKKLAEAKEKKKIAEERMSRSTSAWSSLKEQFL
ncbi:hypothetical protein CDL15_Pgr015863 [Punica granatum]|uniref:MATH domain-containing protein n=1 Tax=Punica granatum TaxID=22663 RepID=A0A218XPB8_PUNGR|nr:hypothetical protein CDL15_Pgr015863 [Punica granatum]